LRTVLPSTAPAPSRLVMLSPHPLGGLRRVPLRLRAVVGPLELAPPVLVSPFPSWASGLPLVASPVWSVSPLAAPLPPPWPSRVPWSVRAHAPVPWKGPMLPSRSPPGALPPNTPLPSPCFYLARGIRCRLLVWSVSLLAAPLPRPRVPRPVRSHAPVPWKGPTLPSMSLPGVLPPSTPLPSPCDWTDTAPWLLVRPSLSQAPPRSPRPPASVASSAPRAVPMPAFAPSGAPSRPSGP